MSDHPLADALKQIDALPSNEIRAAVKVDSHLQPIAEADASLGIGRGWSVGLHAQYGQALADRWAAAEVTWKKK